MKQQYDSYKPSGIDWIGDIPSHWKIQRLKFGMNLINGRAYLQPELLSEGKYRILRVGNFFTNDSWYYSDMELEDNKYCSKGDLLYAWSASIGPYIWNEEKVIFHYHIWKVGLSGKMDKKYSFYLLDVITKVKLNDMHGSAMQHLTMENMNNSDIIVPPLAEQEAIAAWLDEKCGEIDAAIAKVDREIELIDELKQSKISRVVTRGLNPDTPLRPSGIDWIGNIPEHWKIVPIKSLGFFTKGLTFTKADLADEGKSVISYGQIHSKLNDKVGIRRELIRYIPDRICLNNASSLTKKGDFIFADTSEDLQGCGNAVYNDTLIPLYGGYHTIILHSFSEDNKYFGYLFLTDAWRSQIRASVSGVKVYSITQSILKNCNILVPPLSEQQAIADYLDKKCAEIDGLKEKLSMKRETLTELRQSIISEVVTGKRKVI